MEIASESKLKLRGKLINERLNGPSLLLKWELIFQMLNSSQECSTAEYRLESDFIKRNQVENSILNQARSKYASVEQNIMETMLINQTKVLL
jgi:hypothetical protein